MKIGDKEYELKFGLAFINYLDKEFAPTTRGIDFGLGITPVITKLEICHPQAVVDIIKAGTITEKQRPSNADIEAFLENCDLKAVCEDFFAKLKKAPMLKAMIVKIEELGVGSLI